MNIIASQFCYYTQVFICKFFIYNIRGLLLYMKWNYLKIMTTCSKFTEIFKLNNFNFELDVKFRQKPVCQVEKLNKSISMEINE